ncbi:MAG: 6-O-methylguanine DNA methyltransferase, partial [Gemmatimonadetes bacterium]|nr:6-O-methylguanine DNA methyltransferase [Gemmatimonadota bacterium]NIR79405.1 6-O-methylguanine DNA methyltransferase [Gemmatimonadota bacterium]NIT90225.1 6-O-methylguanine DNA methyltransferase [Gemmatimonadota bacterium]NIU34053.1 6-O-methylguanine DNA methyltransferase [Gemmatimonadota bacterium]NIU36525.1 6-O-methylguanine DNA methyltransferase [Gemmatimonadota bacterium]
GVCFLAFVGDDEEDALGELRSRWPRARIVEDPTATAPLAREIV